MLRVYLLMMFGLAIPDINTAQRNPEIIATASDLSLRSPRGDISLTDRDGTISLDQLRQAISNAALVPSLQSTLQETQSTLQETRGELSTARSTIAALVVNQTNTSRSLYDTTLLSSTNGDNIITLQNQLLTVSEELSQFINESNTTTPLRRSCRELWEAGVRTDGSYRVQPTNNSRSEYVYCDMSNGGWTLVAMVHSCTFQRFVTVDEPNNFFVVGLQSGVVQLSHNYNNNCASPMAIGAHKFDDYLTEQISAGSNPKVKFVLHAELDYTQTCTYYKEISSIDSWNTLFTSTNQNYPSRVCRDEAMTSNCNSGNYIGYNSNNQYTTFEGMSLYDDSTGQMLSTAGQLAMRMNDDADARSGSGVCSLSFGDGRWADNTFMHWGNALRVWVK